MGDDGDGGRESLMDPRIGRAGVRAAAAGVLVVLQRAARRLCRDYVAFLPALIHYVVGTHWYIQA